ncbi:hypothetical protein BJX63DRAFT_437376 [Aspergillus granulosus]|uniref:Uncharacterized protein n=1 Tax=Aspergillus granulosus TaxID=176169 RepID=A0ABR4GVJ7_9EURO
MTDFELPTLDAGWDMYLNHSAFPEYPSIMEEQMQPFALADFVIDPDTTHLFGLSREFWADVPGEFEASQEPCTLQTSPAGRLTTPKPSSGILESATSNIHCDMHTIDEACPPRERSAVPEAIEEQSEDLTTHTPHEPRNNSLGPDIFKNHEANTEADEAQPEREPSIISTTQEPYCFVAAGEEEHEIQATTGARELPINSSPGTNTDINGAQWQREPSVIDLTEEPSHEQPHEEQTTFSPIELDINKDQWQREPSVIDLTEEPSYEQPHEEKTTFSPIELDINKDQWQREPSVIDLTEEPSHEQPREENTTFSPIEPDINKDQWQREPSVIDLTEEPSYEPSHEEQIIFTPLEPPKPSTTGTDTAIQHRMTVLSDESDDHAAGDGALHQPRRKRVRWEREDSVVVIPNDDERRKRRRRRREF